MAQGEQAAAASRRLAPNDAGITEFIIPAGRCALLRHVGSDDHLGRSIRHLFAEWLPGSNAEPREFPLFLQRVAFFPDVPDSEAVTGIYLPLRRENRALVNENARPLRGRASLSTGRMASS